MEITKGTLQSQSYAGGSIQSLTIGGESYPGAGDTVKRQYVQV